MRIAAPRGAGECLPRISWVGSAGKRTDDESEAGARRFGYGQRNNTNLKRQDAAIVLQL